LLKKEAIAQQIKKEQSRKLKEEQKAHAKIKQKAIILAKKQAKALEAIRESLNKSAKSALLLRKALVLPKVRVVVP
jgi:archaeosine-15-forming tRNA-guanine transglycosylase